MQELPPIPSLQDEEITRKTFWTELEEIKMQRRSDRYKLVIGLSLASILTGVVLVFMAIFKLVFVR